MGILFKNGTVVTSTAMYQADVRIQGEKITEVGQDLCIKDDQAVDELIRSYERVNEMTDQLFELK